jgi:hypothetical protein
METRKDFPFAEVPKDMTKAKPMSEDEIEAYATDMFLKIYKQLTNYSQIPATLVLMGDTDLERSTIDIEAMMGRTSADVTQVVEGITGYISGFEGVTAVAFFSTVGTLNVSRNESPERLAAYQRDVQAVQAGELNPNDSEFSSPGLLCTLQFRNGRAVGYMCPYKKQNGKNVIQEDRKSTRLNSSHTTML